MAFVVVFVVLMMIATVSLIHFHSFSRGEAASLHFSKKKMCSLVLFLHAYIHSLRKGPEPFLPNKDISRSHFSLKEGEAQLQVGQIHVPTVGTKHSSLVYVQRPSF